MTNASKFAVNLELQEQRLFRSMMSLTDNIAIRQVLSMMVEDEKAVISRIAKLCQTGEEAACITTVDLSQPLQTVLDDFRPEMEMKEMHTGLDAYRFILRVERAIESVYEKMAMNTNNPRVREALHEIIHIKQAQLQEVDDMFQFANAPNEYLEWGEFSNQTGIVFHQFGRDVG